MYIQHLEQPRQHHMAPVCFSTRVTKCQFIIKTHKNNTQCKNIEGICRHKAKRWVVQHDCFWTEICGASRDRKRQDVECRWGSLVAFCVHGFVGSLAVADQTVPLRCAPVNCLHAGAESRGFFRSKTSVREHYDPSPRYSSATRRSCSDSSFAKSITPSTYHMLSPAGSSKTCVTR